MSRDNKKSDVIMNEDITAKEVRCTNDSGENYGIIPTAQALALADEAGLDLVLIAADATPPVAKIMDYSKFKYQQEKKKKEAKKKAASSHRRPRQLGAERSGKKGVRVVWRGERGGSNRPSSRRCNRSFLGAGGKAGGSGRDRCAAW